MTADQLNELKNVDVRTVDPTELKDIKDIYINDTLSVQERLLQYMKQIGNPYVHKCGDVIVKNSFLDAGVTMEELFKNYLRKMVV